MTKFICEIGSNHNKDINRCYEMIKKAKKIGAYGVKFQYFKAEKLYNEKYKKQIDIMKKRELPLNFFPKLKQCCEDYGMRLGCSVFDLSAPGELKSYVDFLKISSYEFLWRDLIVECLKTEKFLFLSSGMTTINEFYDIYNFVENKGGKNVCLMHCVSCYPARPEDCNLNILNDLKNLIRNYKIGWSDHTKHEGVIYSAITNGAEYIECHFDLDGKGWEFDFHCWLPNELKRVIKIGKTVKLAGGQAIKKLLPIEDLKMRMNFATGRRGV